MIKADTVWTTLKAMAALLPLSIAPAYAEDEGPSDSLVIELNAAQSSDGGCSFSFFITNSLSDPIDAMVLEAVLFNAEGQVDRLTLFDFGQLPAGRPRVRQFVVPGSNCDAFGSVLINGAQTCETGGSASTLCEDTIELRSRVDVELIG